MDNHSMFDSRNILRIVEAELRVVYYKVAGDYLLHIQLCVELYHRVRSHGRRGVSPSQGGDLLVWSQRSNIIV